MENFTIADKAKLYKLQNKIDTHTATIAELCEAIGLKLKQQNSLK